MDNNYNNYNQQQGNPYQQGNFYQQQGNPYQQQGNPYQHGNPYQQKANPYQQGNPYQQSGPYMNSGYGNYGGIAEEPQKAPVVSCVLSGMPGQARHASKRTIKNKWAKKLLADGGYTGENFANEIKRISGAEVEVVKRNELHTFAVLPKRWIVERSFAWLDKYRRLWKNCERKLQNSFQMISLAFIRLLLKRY